MVGLVTRHLQLLGVDVIKYLAHLLDTDDADVGLGVKVLLGGILHEELLGIITQCPLPLVLHEGGLVLGALDHDLDLPQHRLSHVLGPSLHTLLRRRRSTLALPLTTATLHISHNTQHTSG